MSKTWQRTEALNHQDSLSAIQPTILQHPEGKLQILVRTKENRIYTSWSDDDGVNWSSLEATNLPNNNSGIDATTLSLEIERSDWLANLNGGLLLVDAQFELLNCTEMGY